MGEETTRLKEEIDRTREELTRDVNRLSDKTSPSRMVERRVQRARGWLASVKEKVMGSSGGSSSGGYASGGYASGYGTSGYGTSGYGTSGYGTSGAEGSGSRLEPAQQATSQLVGTAREGLSSTRASVSHAGERASEAAHGAVADVRQGTEGNPLAAGLVAFGVGWLVSSLLPASDMETQAAQRAGEVTRDQGGAVLEQAKQSATEVAQELKTHAQDAATQVKETAQQAAAEVKDTAQEHAQATREDVRSSVSG